MTSKVNFLRVHTQTTKPILQPL